MKLKENKPPSAFLSLADNGQIGGGNQAKVETERERRERERERDSWRWMRGKNEGEKRE